MNGLKGRKFENILIIKPSAAGDIICALPVLAGLRKLFPDAKITWLVSSHFAELLSGHPLLDNIIEFSRRRFGYVGRSWIVTKRFIKFLDSLKSANFDLVVDLQGLFRSGFLTWSTRANVRIGPAEKRELSWVFYTHRSPSLDFDSHTVDRMYVTLKLFTDNLPDIEFPVYIPNDARKDILERLCAYGLKEGKYIVVAPGGTWESKRWPAYKFVELIKQVSANFKIPTVLIGGKHEMVMGEKIVSELTQYPMVNFIGRTSLSELLAVIDAAKLLISNDSGPMHMGVALGKPVIALIGPTNPYRTGPYGQMDNVIKSSLPCMPCYKRKCPYSEVSKCMEEIKVESVLDKLKMYLSSP